MPYYEYFCEPCDEVFTKKRPFEEASSPLQCAKCEGEAVRVFSAPQFINAQGPRATDTWNKYYSGEEVGPGMTRAQTMQIARQYHKDQKNYVAPVSTPKMISTPSHPASQPYIHAD